MNNILVSVSVDYDFNYDSQDHEFYSDDVIFNSYENYKNYMADILASIHNAVYRDNGVWITGNLYNGLPIEVYLNKNGAEIFIFPK